MLTSFANSPARQKISPFKPSQGHESNTNIKAAEGTVKKITSKSPNAREKMYLEEGGE